MDFFEAQAAAQRSTRRLIGLFAAAIVALVTVSVFLLAVFTAWSSPPTGVVNWSKISGALSLQTWLMVTGAVLLLVVIASLFRLAGLRGGGRSVAESLGGSLLQPNTTDPGERRLLNVVEEMAIASGLPVPPVYILDEPGINAFAAGYGNSDAVLGITRGAIETLNRDELQGVIGHEFSHVLNGDMRLNIRLIAILYGILAIGLIGRVLLHGGGRSRRGADVRIALFGLAIMVVGYAGTFFGNLIKAAVSRQREYLADASAVQFTRNPRGIADALRRIGGNTTGSRIDAGNAEEMSHMFFSQSFSGFLSGLYATHPPLDARIRAVDPQWDGSFLFEVAEAAPAEDGATEDRTAQHAPAGLASGDLAEVIPAAAVALGAASGALGTITPDHVDQAHDLIEGIPRALHDAAHDPLGARAVIYCLLLDEPASEADETGGRLLDRQLAFLDAQAERGVPELTRTLLPERAALEPGARIPLAHLTIPALKMLSEEQYRRFNNNMTGLIRSDARISSFEWVLHQVLGRDLKAHFDGVDASASRNRSLAQEARACAVLLTSIARAGHPDDGAREAFASGAALIDLSADAWVDAEDENLQALNRAIGRLRRLHPLAQPRLLKAAIATIEHDGQVLAEERDLLQGIAAALDCPMPPLGRD